MVRIDSTKFGSITIDGRTYHDKDNYIISWDGETIGLHTAERHLFGKPELERMLKKNPEMIVVGIGVSGLLRVSDEVRSLCREKGIKFVEMISREAIVKFNENLDKRVVAFIHVTC